MPARAKKTLPMRGLGALRRGSACAAPTGRTRQPQQADAHQQQGARLGDLTAAAADPPGLSLQVLPLTESSLNASFLESFVPLSAPISQ